MSTVFQETPHSSNEIEDEMFDLAPVSLWLEDYDGIRTLFDAWRTEGIEDIRAHLRADPQRVLACSAAIRVIKVNQRTLELYEANSFEHLRDNLALVFRDDMFEAHVDELAQLWEGQSAFSSHTVNYTMTGRRLDIQLSGRILPREDGGWSRVLVSIENVTARETARRLLAKSEAYARGLFDHSPVSLWVEDFSDVKRLLDDVRRTGVVDFRIFTDVHPEFVVRCLSEIRVIDVNSQTARMFKAPDRETVLSRIGDVFKTDMLNHFREQLIDLWEGRLAHHREVINYALDGTELFVHLQFSVFPGHEHDWSLVLISLTDITARKKAEAYLEFLGKHDVTTRLYNRSFYVDELNRLERRRTEPVTIIVADLNGLKEINDTLGHNAGDALLRRAGEVLGESVQEPNCAARIGGDEFAIILPGSHQDDGAAVIESILNVLEMNNQYFPGTPLSMALGMATSLSGERLESVFSRADAAMYVKKRAHYEDLDHDRRKVEPRTVIQ